MIALQGKHAHAHRALHGIRIFHKNPFVCGRNRNKVSPFRFAEILTERFPAEQILYPPHTIIAHFSGNVNRTVPRMIMPVVELPEHGRVYPVIILFLHQPPAGMRFAIHRFHQRPVRQKIHFGRIDHELLDIIIYDNTQLLLRKYWFFHDRLQYLQSLRQVFIQRIKRDVGIFRCAGQLQPCAVIVQLLRYFQSAVPQRSFTQHTVGEQSLQRLRLLPASAFHQQVYAYHFIIAGIENVQKYAVGHDGASGHLYGQMLDIPYFRLDGSVQKHHQSTIH